MHVESEKQRLANFLEKFSNEDIYAKLRKLRWGGLKRGKCPRCGSTAVQSDIREGYVEYFRCLSRNPASGSEYQSHERVVVFTVRTGTVLENSHLPLALWAYCLALRKLKHNPFVATHLAELLNITRKSATAILRRLDEVYGARAPGEGETVLRNLGVFYEKELKKL